MIFIPGWPSKWKKKGSTKKKIMKFGNERKGIYINASKWKKYWLIYYQQVEVSTEWYLHQDEHHNKR